MKKFIWSGKKQRDYLEKGIMKYSHKERLRIISSKLNFIFSNYSRKIRGLDIGCGDGIFIKSLSSINDINFIGCDADCNRLLQAREYCQRTPYFINSVAEKAPFRDNTFDLILLHYVLEHTEDNKGVLNECVRILRTNGIFILGIPNENSLNGRILRFLHSGLYKKGEHIHFYSEHEVVDLLSSFPFKILSINRVGFIFPVYYIHMLLISNKITFKIGNFLTKVLKFSADSLIVVLRNVKNRESD